MYGRETGQDDSGPAREITPQRGDTFTILDQWIDLSQSEEQVEYIAQEGSTLTFGDQNFTWEEIAAPAGGYIIGFIVKDMDGNTFEEYEAVIVE